MTDRTIDREEEGHYDQRKVAGAMAFGTMFLAILAISVLSIGMVGANLGVGMGGFIASFDQVVNNDSTTRVIAPTIGNNPACADAPQLVASLPGTTYITGPIAFYKDLPAPAALPVDIARISIYSPNTNGITTQDLDLRLSALNASKLTLGNASSPSGTVDISEHSVQGETQINDSYAANTAPNPGDGEFDIQVAPGAPVNISQGKAAAHAISFGQIELPNLQIAVQMGNSSEFSAEGQPVERVIQPNERTCSALAQASAPSEWGAPAQ